MIMCPELLATTQIVSAAKNTSSWEEIHSPHNLGLDHSVHSFVRTNVLMTDNKTTL